MLTTGISILLFVIAQYRYTKNKLQISLRIFDGSNKIYMLLSILFIPISLLIRLFNLPFIINIIVTMIVCVTFYVGILYLRKDENLLLILDKVFGKLKRIVRRKNNG